MIYLLSPVDLMCYFSWIHIYALILLPDELNADTLSIFPMSKHIWFILYLCVSDLSYLFFPSAFLHTLIYVYPINISFISFYWRNPIISTLLFDIIIYLAVSKITLFKFLISDLVKYLYTPSTNQSSYSRVSNVSRY